jgi:hypothetical protein
LPVTVAAGGNPTDQLCIRAHHALNGIAAFPSNCEPARDAMSGRAHVSASTRTSMPAGCGEAALDGPLETIAFGCRRSSAFDLLTKSSIASIRQ